MINHAPPDPTQRFSDRAANYRKYRPGYPEALYAYLREHAGLSPGDRVADLGSGTGLLSLLFLNHGHEVYGIEPNEAMRGAAEENFADLPNFHSMAGKAEAIPLPDASVDFVVAGQAFHWFEPKATKGEVLRILKPGKQVALVWNNRNIELNPFHRDYEHLLKQFGIDYAQVARRWVITNDVLAAWFAPHPMRQAIFPNPKRVDAEGLSPLQAMQTTSRCWKRLMNCLPATSLMATWSLNTGPCCTTEKLAIDPRHKFFKCPKTPLL